MHPGMVCCGRVRHEPVMESWLQRGNNWMSNNVQNEIIELFSHKILREIAAKAASSPFFCITADGLFLSSFPATFSFQFKDLHVQNYFLGFYNAPDTTANMLILCIKDVLVLLNIPMERLKGYCFDGASNMSGRFKGVQARLKEVRPDSACARRQPHFGSSAARGCKGCVPGC